MSLRSVPAAAPPPAMAMALHPVTLAGLALMILNDGWLRSRWPGLVTGKLSDVAALICFPGLLLGAWGLAGWGVERVRRGLGRPPRAAVPLGPWSLGVAVIVPVGILVAINLSVAARDGYLALLGALDPGGWLGPFHYTLDPTDLWTLPAASIPAVTGGRLLGRRPRLSSAARCPTMTLDSNGRRPS